MDTGPLSATTTLPPWIGAIAAAVTVAVVLIGSAIGYGRLQADVTNLTTDVAVIKADIKTLMLKGNK